MIVFALCLAAPLGAQESDHQRALRLLTAIGERMPDASAAIGWLKDSTRQGATLPPDVLDGLQDLADAADAAATLGETARAEFMKRAAADLGIKADYCLRHPRGMAALVDVTVHTWEPDAAPRVEARQWNVMYLSAPMAVFPDRKGKSFPGFSSPAARQLPPGNYVMWAEDPADSSRRGPRKEIQVGDPSKPVDTRVIADLLVAARGKAPQRRP